MTKYLLCTVENIQVPHWTSVLVFGAAAAAAAAVVVVVVASAGSDVLLHIMVVDLVSVHYFAAVGTDGLQLLVACGAAPVVLGVHVAQNTSQAEEVAVAVEDGKYAVHSQALVEVGKLQLALLGIPEVENVPDMIAVPASDEHLNYMIAGVTDPGYAVPQNLVGVLGFAVLYQVVVFVHGFLLEKLASDYHVMQIVGNLTAVAAECDKRTAADVAAVINIQFLTIGLKIITQTRNKNFDFRKASN